MIEPGVTISGRLVTEVLGEGGFARVLAADGPDGRVAVKVATEPRGEEMLRAEAAALARLQGPRFVRLLEAKLDAEPPHLVLERCEGGDLRARLAAAPGGRLEPREAAWLVCAVAETVGAAHALGIVHGDLKPENVLFDAADGLPKVADWGLSRGAVTRVTLGVAASLVTEVARVAGTLDFMAPEVRRGADPTARSDVYGLGVMLYELLTGERPLGLFPPPSRLAPGVPRRLDAVVLAALHSDPAARPADARAFARRLDAVERPSTSLLVGLAISFTASFLVSVPLVLAPRSPDKHVVFALATILGVLGVALLDVGLKWYERPRQTPCLGYELALRLAERGDARALCAVGLMFLHPTRGAPDRARALHCLSRAAQGGRTEAMFHAGLLLEQVPATAQEGRSWLQRAAASGHEGALRRLNLVVRVRERPRPPVA